MRATNQPLTFPLLETPIVPKLARAGNTSANPTALPKWQALLANLATSPTLG